MYFSIYDIIFEIRHDLSRNFYRSICYLILKSPGNIKYKYINIKNKNYKSNIKNVYESGK